MSDTPPQLRVGDRERRAVDERLLAAVGDGDLTLHEYDERSAVLWRARTRDELDVLVADLPAEPAAVAPSTPTTVPDRPRRAVAVMSEDRLSGRVAAGQQVQGWAVMGKAVLDLRRDDLPAHVEVQVRSVMGEVEVLVPPGASVHLSGFAVMGERTTEVDAGNGPEVHVDAIAVMGSVKVGHGDGTVARTGRPSAAPPRASSVAVPGPHAVHRSGGGLSRLLRRGKGLLVPAALLGAVVLAGPDNVSIFGDGFERVAPDDRNVQISTLFGSTTVVVPDGRTVDFGGVFPFGSRECVGECATATGPVVHVRTFGGFGSVEVMTKSQYEQEQRQEQEEERREDLQERREDQRDDD